MAARAWYYKIFLKILQKGLFWSKNMKKNFGDIFAYHALAAILFLFKIAHFG